jgi:hypothetical protein
VGNPNVYLENITIVTDQNLNNNTATALDLVLIYDANLLGQVVAMNATDYFIKKKQLMKDNPKLIDVMPFELVPGQVLPDLEVTLSRLNAEGAILFAGYQTLGDHRLKIGRQKTLLIKMQQEDFIITPEN